jgi:hypothetical protein
VALAGLAGPVVITTEAAAEAAAAAGGGRGGGGAGAADSVSISPSFHLPALQHYHKKIVKKTKQSFGFACRETMENRLPPFVCEP